jgi:hypothetical protein
MTNKGGESNKHGQKKKLPRKQKEQKLEMTSFCNVA